MRLPAVTWGDGHFLQWLERVGSLLRGWCWGLAGRFPSGGMSSINRFAKQNLTWWVQIAACLRSQKNISCSEDLLPFDPATRWKEKSEKLVESGHDSVSKSTRSWARMVWRAICGSNGGLFFFWMAKICTLCMISCCGSVCFSKNWKLWGRAEVQEAPRFKVSRGYHFDTVVLVLFFWQLWFFCAGEFTQCKCPECQEMSLFELNIQNMSYTWELNRRPKLKCWAQIGSGHFQARMKIQYIPEHFDYVFFGNGWFSLIIEPPSF